MLAEAEKRRAAAGIIGDRQEGLCGIERNVARRDPLAGKRSQDLRALLAIVIHSDRSRAFIVTIMEVMARSTG